MFGVCLYFIVLCCTSAVISEKRGVFRVENMRPHTFGQLIINCSICLAEWVWALDSLPKYISLNSSRPWGGSYFQNLKAQPKCLFFFFGRGPKRIAASVFLPFLSLSISLSHPPWLLLSPFHSLPTSSLRLYIHITAFFSEHSGSLAFHSFMKECIMGRMLICIRIAYPWLMCHSLSLFAIHAIKSNKTKQEIYKTAGG